MTHDYKRNGTTTLFAALNALDGLVIGRIMQRHRHQEFIRFLNTIEGFFAKLTPGGPKYGVLHSIVDLQAAINRFIKSSTRSSARSSGRPNRTKSSPPSGEGTKNLPRSKGSGIQTLDRG